MSACAIFAQPANDAALEARVKALSSELRCLVCQNQTIADSDAAVARDMRDQVRTQLRAGKTEAEVKTYMTERFGDFVLYKPAFKLTTLLLWLGPFLVLTLSIFGFVRHVRNRSAVAAEPALTERDRLRAQSLLNANQNGVASTSTTATEPSSSAKN
ncbi:MAG: cytochrome c-type biogenesis protein CcmH [Betaproteobacteria bacterium]|nr:MAG: cytochrome c-type biogenesis protein CcmH [Betaproteobacteria bacterium]